MFFYIENSYYLKLKTLAKKISTETTLKTEKDKTTERTNYEIEQRRKDLAMDGQYNDKTISKTLPSINSISKGMLSTMYIIVCFQYQKEKNDHNAINKVDKIIREFIKHTYRSWSLKSNFIGHLNSYF